MKYNKNGVVLKDSYENRSTKFTTGDRHIEMIARHSVSVWLEQVQHKGVINLADLEESNGKD